MNKRKLTIRMREEANRVLADKKARVLPAAVKTSASARRALPMRRVLLIAAAVLLTAAIAVSATIAVLMKRNAPAPDTSLPSAETSVPGTDGANVPADAVSSDAGKKTDGPSMVVPPELAALPRVIDMTYDFDVPAAYTAIYNVRRAYTPDRDGQEALAALKEDGGETYPKMQHLASRFCENNTENGVVFDTTPFIVWGLPQYRDFYYFFEIDAAELGVAGEEFYNKDDFADGGGRFIYEMWYKVAGSDEDYRGIRTEPDSRVLPYVFPAEDDGPQYVVFRMPTYNEGIRDLHTNDGEPVDYEFIIVIRDRTAEPDHDVLGWGEIVITIDAQYEEHLAQAFEEGLLPLPQ